MNLSTKLLNDQIAELKASKATTPSIMHPMIDTKITELENAVIAASKPTNADMIFHAVEKQRAKAREDGHALRALLPDNLQLQISFLANAIKTGWYTMLRLDSQHAGLTASTINRPTRPAMAGVETFDPTTLLMAVEAQAEASLHMQAMLIEAYLDCATEMRACNMEISQYDELPDVRDIAQQKETRTRMLEEQRARDKVAAKKSVPSVYQMVG